MEQARDRRQVMDVRGRAHHRMDQSRVHIDPDVRLHPERPLLALAGLVHLRIPLAATVLRRTRRADDRGIHDRARAHLQPSRLQHLAHRGKQLLAQIVPLQQAPELQKGRAIGHALTAQVDAHHEAVQRRAVQQRFLTGLIGQIEPVLHEVHAQHALQPHGQAPVARLGVVRLDHSTQLLPRHDPFHRRQKLVALGRATVWLKSTATARVCCFIIPIQRIGLPSGGLVQRCPNRVAAG